MAKVTRFDAALGQIPGRIENISQQRMYGTLAERLKGFADRNNRRADLEVETAARAQGYKDAVEQGAANVEVPGGHTIRDEAYAAGVAQVYLSDIYFDIDEGLKNLELQYENDPLTYKEQVNAYGEGLLRELPEELQPEVRQEFSIKASRGLVRTMERHKQKTHEENVAVMHKTVKTMRRNVLNAIADDDEVLFEQEQKKMEGLLELGVESGLFTAKQAEEYRAQLEQDADESAIIGEFNRVLMDQGPEGGAKALDRFRRAKHPEITPGHKLLITDKMESLLRREKRIINELNAERTEQRLLERSRQASDLEIGVRAGQKDEADIELAFEDGIITGPKRTQLFNELEAQKQAKQKQALSMGLVHASLTSSVPLDSKNPDHRTAVDSYFAANVTENMQHNLALSVDLASKTGIIATPVQSMIRSLSKSGDTNQAVMAANTLARLQESAPQSLDSVPASEKAFAMQINTMVAAGTDPKQAVEIARHNVYQMTAPEREVVKGNYHDANYREKNLSTLTDYIDDAFDKPFRTEPEAPAAMQGEYSALTEQYFMQTQDIEQARALAWHDLSRVWGVTDLNGDGLSLMKYPPEKIYWNGQPNDWMAEQLAEDLQALGVSGEARIVSDHITARSKQPSYALMKRRKNGLFEPVLDKNNQPARWRPDFALTSQAKQMQREQINMLNKAEDQLERLRTRRKRELRRRRAN